MEYTVARAWLRMLGAIDGNIRSPESLIDEAADAIGEFPNGFSAIQFFDQMLGLTGSLVNRAIARIGAVDEAVFAAHQFALLQAFENMNVHDANDEVLAALDRLERVARDDVKLRLGQTLIRIQAIWGEHPIIRSVMSRVLEVSKEPNMLTPASATKMGHTTHGTSSEEVDRETAVDSPSNPTTVAPTREDMVRLPPARFHYTEETKLNAIALLVSSDDLEAHELAKSAIERLGRVDLHAALDALLQLDDQSDAAVFRMLPEFVEQRGDEYRIFAAWLLRKRFGVLPADYLSKLLCDPSTRVHRFTVNLFDAREIEEELITSVLKLLQKGDSNHNWHLVNLIRLLGQRDKFRTSCPSGEHA